MKSPVIPSIRTNDQKAFNEEVRRALENIRLYYKGKDSEQKNIVVKVPVIPSPVTPITPVPPSPGTYTEILKTAINCNFCACTSTDKGLFGFIEPGISGCNSFQSSSNVGVNWFLIDASLVVPPSGFGSPGQTIRITVTGMGIVTEARLHPIDASNGLTFAEAYQTKGFTPPYDIILDNGQGVTKSLYSVIGTVSQRYLLEIVGTGGNISVYYGP